MNEEQVRIIAEKIRELEQNQSTLRDMMKDIYGMYKEIINVLEEAK